MALYDQYISAYGKPYLPPGSTMPVQPYLPPGTPNPVRPFLPPGTPNPNQLRPTLPPGTPNPVRPFLPPGTPLPMPGTPPPLNTNPRGFQGGNSNPWLNRYTGYRNSGPGDYNTELSRQAGELDPRAEYARIANAANMGGTDRRSQFGQNQFNAFQNAYNASQLENINLNLRDFINQSGGAQNLRNQWQMLTPSQRGLNNAGKSSVIRWG